MIVSLMKKKFVDELHWIEEKEMLDLVAIAQSSPGAIAINGAIVVGYKLAGITGVLVSIIGTIIPPFVIISLLSVCYNTFRSNELVSQMLEGMQAGVGAVIASVTYEMGTGVVKEKDGISLLIMAGAFVAAILSNGKINYFISLFFQVFFYYFFIFKPTMITSYCNFHELYTSLILSKLNSPCLTRVIFPSSDKSTIVDGFEPTSI